MQSSKIFLLRLALILTPMAFVATPAIAQNSGSQDSRAVVFASGYVGEDINGTLGFVFAPRGLGQGFALRGSVMAGSYDYMSGATQIEADYKGADLAVVYQWSAADFYANVALGARYTDTELSPADPGNGRTGQQWDAVAAVDGSRTMGRYQLNGYASYGFQMEEYYVRADALRGLTPTGPWLGLEAGAQGDPNYERQMVGVVLKVAATTDWEVRVSGGASRQDTGDGGYLSLGLVRVF